MKFMPHEYQKYAIEYIKSHPITALILDMGLGKTVTTLPMKKVRSRALSTPLRR